MRGCRAAGVDAVLVPLGTLAAIARDVGMLGVVMSMRDVNDPQQVVELALRRGVDAIKYEAFPLGPLEAPSMQMLESLGRSCEAGGMPLLAEMIPNSFDAVQDHTVVAVAHSARMGMECGADLVKVPPPIDGDLHAVVEYVSIPVLVLGGAATDSHGFVTSMQQHIVAGAAGIAVGRNVFDAPDPMTVAAELAAVVHGAGK